MCFEIIFIRIETFYLNSSLALPFFTLVSFGVFLVSVHVCWVFLISCLIH